MHLLQPDIEAGPDYQVPAPVFIPLGALAMALLLK